MGNLDENKLQWNNSNGIFFASFLIREYKNTSSAIGELYVRSRFFCNHIKLCFVVLKAWVEK